MLKKKKRLASSASKIASNNGVKSQISFINIENSRGPSYDPCGKPRITFLYLVLLDGEQYIVFYSVSNFEEVLSY